MKLLASIILGIATFASTTYAESCSYNGFSGTCTTPANCASLNRWWVPNECSGGTSLYFILPSTHYTFLLVVPSPALPVVLTYSETTHCLTFVSIFR